MKAAIIPSMLRPPNATFGFPRCKVVEQGLDRHACAGESRDPAEDFGITNNDSWCVVALQ